MKNLLLPSGRRIPQFGQGTWEIGHKRSQRKQEIEALQLGIDQGMTLIDTAEMYGEGESERVVGEAVAGRRDQVYMVSKVYPHNGTLKGVIAACHASLQRLNTSYLDLYLLHWRGSVPLEQTLAGFQKLKQEGKILDYGVSNFDLSDMEEAAALTGGDDIASNQVLYNLRHRGLEYDLLPYCKKKHIPIMAYSPIDKPGESKKELIHDKRLKEIASRHGATAAQIALAWLLHQQVVVIPKSGNPAHVMENCNAAGINLSQKDLEAIDAAFPAPVQKVSLAMR